MTIHSNLSLCHPKAVARFTALANDLIRAYEAGETKTLFKVFETYRDPFRQADLITKRVTKAGPFQSAHQYGLAVDYVPFIDSDDAARLSDLTGERHFVGWNWHSTHDYRFLATRAKHFQLTVPITWDPCHVQHPDFYVPFRDLK